MFASNKENLKCNNPIISIIVPNYNHAPFLIERLETIYNQTFQDFEVILLDDCSTDNSVEILSKYAKHPKTSHFIINEKNSGSPFLQWQKGFTLAKGKYIWIAESDDFCELNFLENLISKMLMDSEIVLAFSQTQFIELNGTKGWVSRDSYQKDVLQGDEFVKKYMVTGSDICNASMALFKSEALHSISPKFTDYRYCGDWLFWIEIALLGKVYSFPEVCNYFRGHKESTISKAFKSGAQFREEWSILQFLHAAGYIKTKEYKRGIREKYIVFLIKKIELDADIAHALEDFFYFNLPNYSFKLFLLITKIVFYIKSPIKVLFKQQFK